MRAVGIVCASIFNKVITRDDMDLRGRRSGEPASLIAEGLRRIDPAFPYEHISSEREAIKKAVSEAGKNELIFICADKVPETLRYVEQLHAERMAEHA